MAKIADLLRAGRTYSFEFPPPRNDEALREFEKTLRELEPLAPSFVSVTYGAGGSSRENTRDAVMHIHRDVGLVAMPHLTCVAQSRAEITDIVERYRAEGIENLLALAGDPPKDGEVAGDFRFATELIELARGLGDFSIGVAAFPEVHPRSTDRAVDRARLAEKLAMADFAITQFFWNVDHWFRFRDEMDALGVTTPIIPSLMPFVTTKRISDINGAEWPDWLAERIAKVEGNAEAVRQLGVDVACEIGERLLASDIPGLHIYTLNKSESAKAVWERLGLSTAPG